MISQLLCGIGFLICLCLSLRFIYVIYVSFIRRGLSPKFFSKSDHEKWAIVTGAGSGIGKGYSEELAAKGYNLILLGRNDETLKETEQSIKSKSSGSAVIREVIDFSQPPESWTPKVQALLDKKNILLLVNNVGMNTEIPGQFVKHNNNHVHQMIECNCTATLEMTQLLLPHFQEMRKGGIIFLSSVAGQYASPYMAVYSATKAFILRFAEALSAEVTDYNVDVLILHPYYVKSKMSGFRKTSFMVCSPNKFARLSFAYLGRNLHGQPYWPHRLLDILFTAAPLWASLGFQKKQMLGVIGRLERRNARRQQQRTGGEEGTGTGGVNSTPSASSSSSSSSSSSADTQPFLKK